MKEFRKEVLSWIAQAGRQMAGPQRERMRGVYRQAAKCDSPIGLVEMLDREAHNAPYERSLTKAMPNPKFALGQICTEAICWWSLGKEYSNGYHGFSTDRYENPELDERAHEMGEFYDRPFA